MFPHPGHRSHAIEATETISTGRMNTIVKAILEDLDNTMYSVSNYFLGQH